MQLVGGSVRLLNPTKGDLIIDEKMVEELMGVPPEKVADVMALMGDSIDNIPGARDPHAKPAPGERRKAGIGDVGARQLIQQFGSAEEALKRAGEVKRASYREALENYGEFVKLSKQLATIPTDAPVPLDLDALTIQQPDLPALRDLYVELGFTSLLRELAPLQTSKRPTMLTLDSSEDLRKFVDAIPRTQETAAWLSLDSQEPDEEGFGTRVLGVEISAKSGTAHIVANDIEDKSLTALKAWARGRQTPENCARPEVVRAPGRPGFPGRQKLRRRNPPRHHALFLSSAAHHRQSRISPKSRCAI